MEFDGLEAPGNKPSGALVLPTEPAEGDDEGALFEDKYQKLAVAVSDDEQEPLGSSLEHSEAPPAASEPHDSSQPFKKYYDEDPSHPNWTNHKKHIFIFSNAGKPIFSRYGDESRLATATALLQALISFVEDDNDKLRVAYAGKHVFLFLVRGPIYLMCVSSTGEPISHITQQLNLLHSLIISHLSIRVHTALTLRPNSDIRDDLNGTESIFAGMINWMNNDFMMPLKAYRSLRLSKQIRNNIGHIIHSARSPNMLYALLATGHNLIQLIRPKKQILQPADFHILTNFVNSRPGTKVSDNWIPICLPRYDETAMLHVYVSFLDDNTWLALIASKPEIFYEFLNSKQKIQDSFVARGMLQAIQSAVETTDISLSELNLQGDIIHFLYKALQTNQITASKLEKPYHTPEERKRLFRAYQKIQAKANRNPKAPQKILWSKTATETMIVWSTSGFQLFATFGMMESLSNIISLCNKILLFIKEQENDIFLLDSPVF